MKKNYKLKRFEEAYIYATRVLDRKELLEFGKAALFYLEIDYGIYLGNKEIKNSFTLLKD